MTDPRHRRQTQQLALIALQAARLPTLLSEAYTAIELTLPDGYPAGGGEPVSGGDTNNPTLGAVLQRERALESVEDHTGDEARRVGLAAVDTSLAVSISARARLRPATHARAHHAARASPRRPRPTRRPLRRQRRLGGHPHRRRLGPAPRRARRPPANHRHQHLLTSTKGPA